MRHNLLAISLFVFCASISAQAGATIVVQDSFTAADNTAMVGHIPDVNLPGSTYVSGNSVNRIGGSTNSGTAANVSNVSVVGNDGAWAISLASAGGYVKPTEFTISADLNLNGMVPDPSEVVSAGQTGIIRGITLGFFDNASTGTNLFNERRSPLGVTYNDAGHLMLVVPNLPLGASTILASVSTFGPGNTPIPTTGTHSLSYQVDTTSQSISNVTFDGVAVNFGVPVTQFTDAATAYAGSYAASGLGNTFGTLDNFTITAVPEPSTFILCGLGAVGLLVAGRRRRKA